MVTVKFKARIKDGRIHIPAKYRRNLGDKVRVILVSDEQKSEKPNILRELLVHPIKIASFEPLNRDEAHAR
jgi:bifunctional DNA-binding transcriptional regulator/antitoxin component of YhaV-PrlF toxin-antitoxin module